MKIREATFALRIVRRRNGDAAIVYRRKLDSRQRERFTRLGAISPLAFTAGTPLLRSAVRATAGASAKLSAGPYHALDPDWGARASCYALLSAGLRQPEGLRKAADNMRNSDGTEAAWWLGLMTRPGGRRAVRALRILAEAVK